MSERLYRYLDLRPGTTAWPGAIADGVIYDADDRVRLAPVDDGATPSTDPAFTTQACDGAVYVSDQDAGRVFELLCDGSITPLGCLRPPLLIAPRGLVAGPRDRLYIADAGHDDTVDGRVLVVDRRTGAVVDIWEGLGRPVDVAAGATADGERVIVTMADGSVVVLDLDGQIDTDPTAAGAVAAAAAGATSASGATGVIARAHTGRLLLGPLPLVEGIDRWDRVVVERDSGDAPTDHVRLWTRTGDTTAAPAMPPPLPTAGEDRHRTGLAMWRACPTDAPDALVLHEPAPYLWICVELVGDGTSTPAVRSVRADHLGAGLAGKLPAIYAAADADETTYRLVQLLAAPLDELAARIDDLPRDFDAAAADAGKLGELGRWLSLYLDDRRNEADRRRDVAEAFARHGLRGTRSDLERRLTDAAGAPVRIDEPFTRVWLWTLGHDLLGAHTMLTPAEAQGAVVGTTAEVDWSHLITDDDVGWPLNADVAHRFEVRVTTARWDQQRERRLRDAIEIEKPAHTLATICVDEPGMSVGTTCVGPAALIGGDCPSDHTNSNPAIAVGARVGSIQIGDSYE